jgi:hypothetical protein
MKRLTKLYLWLASGIIFATPAYAAETIFVPPPPPPPCFIEHATGALAVCVAFGQRMLFA